MAGEVLAILLAGHMLIIVNEIGEMGQSSVVRCQVSFEVPTLRWCVQEVAGGELYYLDKC